MNRRLTTAALAGFSALLVGIGIGRFAYPPLIPVLVLHGWFTAPAADYLASINLIGYVVGALLAGRYGRRWPLGRVARGAMLAVIASYALCAAPGPFVWFALWRLVAGIAAAFLMVLAIPALLAVAPQDKRGRLSGFVFMGIGAGEVVAGFGIGPLVRHSVAAAWLGMAAVAALACAATWPYWGPARFASDPSAETSEPGGISRSMAVLLAAYCCAAFALAPATLYWVDFLARGLHQGTTLAGRYWSLFGVAAIAGPPGYGLLSGKLGLPRSMTLCCLLMAAATALPLAMTATPAIVAATVGMGVFGPGVTALFSARTLEITPPALHQPAWGWMTAAFSISYALSAWLMAALYAATRSYALPFELAAAAALGAAALCLPRRTGLMESLKEEVGTQPGPREATEHGNSPKQQRRAAR